MSELPLRACDHRDAWDACFRLVVSAGLIDMCPYGDDADDMRDDPAYAAVMLRDVDYDVVERLTEALYAPQVDGSQLLRTSVSVMPVAHVVALLGGSRVSSEWSLSEHEPVEGEQDYLPFN